MPGNQEPTKCLLWITVDVTICLLELSITYQCVLMENKCLGKGSDWVWIPTHASGWYFLVPPIKKANCTYQNWKFKNNETSLYCKTEDGAYALRMGSFFTPRIHLLMVNQDVFLGIQEILDSYYRGFPMLLAIRGPVNVYDVQAELSSLPLLHSQDLLHQLWWNMFLERHSVQNLKI